MISVTCRSNELVAEILVASRQASYHISSILDFATVLVIDKLAECVDGLTQETKINHLQFIGACRAWSRTVILSFFSMHEDVGRWSASA